jgi:hypothetical protein
MHLLGFGKGVGSAGKDAGQVAVDAEKGVRIKYWVLVAA